MSLRIRRGTDAQRQGVVFDLGEPIWTTDTKQLFVGDGTTVGGTNILANSAGVGLLWNTATLKFDATGGGGGGGGGITAISQDTNPTLGGNLLLNGHNISGTGNISITGSISTSGTANITGGLGANLSLNSYNITGSGSITIAGTSTSSTIVANSGSPATSYTTGALVVTGGAGISGALYVNGATHSGSILLDTNLSTGGIRIETNSGGSTSYDLLSINSYTTDTIGSQLFFSRSRGSYANPTALQNNDNIMNLVFSGRSVAGTQGSGAGIAVAASISVYATGAISSGVMPGTIVFSTTNSAGTTSQRFAIGPEGVLQNATTALVAGSGSGQVNTGSVATYMPITFNGVNYAIPLYAIRP